MLHYTVSRFLADFGALRGTNDFMCSAPVITRPNCARELNMYTPGAGIEIADFFAIPTPDLLGETGHSDPTAIAISSARLPTRMAD